MARGTPGRRKIGQHLCSRKSRAAPGHLYNRKQLIEWVSALQRGKEGRRKLGQGQDFNTGHVRLPESRSLVERTPAWGLSTEREGRNHINASLDLKRFGAGCRQGGIKKRKRKQVREFLVNERRFANVRDRGL